jgi:hypothetical protein
VVDIFSEVEEEVRKERWEKLWKRYGNYVIAAAALVVTAVAGWQTYQRYEQSQREAASVEFINAMNTADAGGIAEAQTAFAALAADGPGGYATTAEFQLVRTHLAQGEEDAAIAILRGLIEENALFGAPARMQLAWLLADTAPRDEIDALIAPLQGEDSPWRFAAAEVTAYLDYRAGDRDASAAAYQALAIDPGVAEGLRQRAGAVAQFLRANAPEATNAPDGAEAPPDSPVEAPPAEEAPAE